MSKVIQTYTICIFNEEDEQIGETLVKVVQTGRKNRTTLSRGSQKIGRYIRTAIAKEVQKQYGLKLQNIQKQHVEELEALS